MLEVVNDEQHLARAQSPVYGLDQWNVPLIGEVDGSSHGRHHLRWFLKWSEFHKDEAITEGLTQTSGDLERETGLSDSSGPGQRQQANLIIAKQSRDVKVLLAPPDQTCQRSGEALLAGRVPDRPIRRQRTTGCREQRYPFFSYESQRIGEQDRGFSIRMRSQPSLQVADCPRADAGAFSQFLLGQVESASVLPQQIAKRRRISIHAGNHACITWHS
jgi:hypothetical protein